MFKRTLLLTCATGVLGAFDAPAFAQSAAPTAATVPPETASAPGTTIGELVVTAQRREENLQDTPIAVSAFSADTLKNSKINGGQDLLLQVPNTNYTRTNFGGSNFKIRGIGTDVVGAGVSGAAGVSINENELPVTANHFQDSEFFDVDRVEVVRGPQGTLYGRNATGGAVDIITTQPKSEFGGFATLSYGNYNQLKATGAVNIPLSDTIAVRIAGTRLVQDGFGTNTYLDQRVDGRDLGAIRATISFKPNDKFSAYLLYEHFGEDDNRNRVGKQLCTPDPGPASVGGVSTAGGYNAFLSQGCLPASLYSNAAYGAVNSNATFGGVVANLIGLNNGTNVFASHGPQGHNLHNIESFIQPLYTAQEDLVDLHMAYNISDNLTLTSITGYNRDVGTNAADYTRIVPTTPFQPVGAAAFLFPNGVVVDPQQGPGNLLKSQDYGSGESKEYTEELRLTSSFKGPLNFSAGGFYSEITAPRNNGTNYYVLNNAATAFSQLNNVLGGALAGGPITIDKGYPPNGSGHNYFDARTGGGYLKSYAGFGEVYYDITPQLKLTLGGRYTVDQLYNLQYPQGLLTAGGGFPTTVCTTSLATCLTPQKLTNREFTGRANLDFTPTLSFTDKTLFYATYSRGYKGGGFNTVCQSQGVNGCGYPLSYNPEFINAYEAGTKNTLLGGSLNLNLTGFYYDYTGYQIAEYLAQSAVNTNVNAKIYGVEFETVYSPIHNLTLNANVGYLHSALNGGQSQVDPLNLTQGAPGYTLVKSGGVGGVALGQNCLAPTAAVAGYIAAGAPAAGLSTQCALSGANEFGLPANIGGNKLPNTPPVTVSAGAQYVFQLPGEWRATLRGDYYWQDDSFARVFNAVNDRLQSYHIVNATLTFANLGEGVDLQVYVKNAFNAQPITGTYLSDPSTGLFTNVFTLDPRTYGAQLTKRF